MHLARRYGGEFSTKIPKIGKNGGIVSYSHGIRWDPAPFVHGFLIFAQKIC